MSQLASSLSERPKGTLPSQPLANSKSSSQAYKVQDPQINQYNVVHTLSQERRWVIKSLSQQVQSELIQLLPPHLLAHLNLLHKHLTKTQLLIKFTSL